MYVLVVYFKKIDVLRSANKLSRKAIDDVRKSIQSLQFCNQHLGQHCWMPNWNSRLAYDRKHKRIRKEYKRYMLVFKSVCKTIVDEGVEETCNEIIWEAWKNKSQKITRKVREVIQKPQIA